MDKLTYVLDTNIIVRFPNILDTLDAKNIIIPVAVIAEVDNFKKGYDSLAHSARSFMRTLESYRQQGSLCKGVVINEQGTKLFVLPLVDKLPSELEPTPDNFIIGTCLQLKASKHKVILLSKDINVRIKADAYSIEAQDYGGDEKVTDTSWVGVSEFAIETEVMESFMASGSLEAKDYELPVNEYIILSCDEQVAYGRFDGTDIKKLAKLPKTAWGLTPRNTEQQFALDAIFDDKVKLVSLVGTAGTGKTLLAIAAGLELVTEQQKYSKLTVSKPVVVLGNDVGYLPGTLEEKMQPYLQQIYDSIEFLLTQNVKPAKGPGSKGNNMMKPDAKELFEQGIMEVVPLTYIRGRSIANQLMIIDEAQNLSLHEMKTIITRASEGTKIILTGDPQQIDQKGLDAFNNGLSQVVERFKGQKIMAYVKLQHGERSELATLGAELL